MFLDGILEFFWMIIGGYFCRILGGVLYIFHTVLEVVWEDFRGVLEGSFLGRIFLGGIVFYYI